MRYRVKDRPYTYSGRTYAVGDAFDASDSDHQNMRILELLGRVEKAPPEPAAKPTPQPQPAPKPVVKEEAKVVEAAGSATATSGAGPTGGSVGTYERRDMRARQRRTPGEEPQQ